MRFLLFLHRKLLFGSQAAQCPKCSDSLCFQAALAFTRMMTSLGWPLCRFAVSASRKWQKVFFWSIDPCISCWLLLGEMLDVGCCKLWTIWRQAASFMSRLVRLLILNKAKSPSWLSIHQQNVIRSGSHTQSSQTLRATSPVLPSTSRRSQTPLELS